MVLGILSAAVSECMSDAYSLYSAFDIIYNAYSPPVILNLDLGFLFTSWFLLFFTLISKIAKLLNIEKVSKPANFLLLCKFS